MKVVCDTSSIIKLQRGGIIDCLGQLFEVVLIPRAVKEECTRPETKAVLQKPFFQIHTVASPLPLSGIHIGELEAISLAVESTISQSSFLMTKRHSKEPWNRGWFPSVHSVCFSSRKEKCFQRSTGYQENH